MQPQSRKERKGRRRENPNLVFLVLPLRSSAALRFNSDSGGFVRSLSIRVLHFAPRRVASTVGEIAEDEVRRRVEADTTTPLSIATQRAGRHHVLRVGVVVPQT